MTDYRSYFEFRQVNPEVYANFRTPAYITKALGSAKSARILDFGCGFGQLSMSLRSLGYLEVEGLDISPEAIDYCRRNGLRCHSADGNEFYDSHRHWYDFVIMSHVVEHFPKDEIIPLLMRVKSSLKPGGAVIVIVPNAQSNTNAYWAYEDFTHHTLFTTGSLYYVLRAAGFVNVEFLDLECLEGLSAPKRLIKKFLLSVYRKNYTFWNRVTSSTVHAPSPVAFSFEVKAIARA